MRRHQVLWEAHVRRFLDALDRHKQGRLSAEEAGELLGLSGRHFRRQCVRYEAEGIAGLRDQRLGCIEDARSFCRAFFTWYNQDHHHAGIGLMTPDQVHYGQIDAVHAARQQTLDRAFAENRPRFVNKPPTPPDKPTAAWINPPTPKGPA